MYLTNTVQHHLRAAHGWLELGDHLSAFEELENIEAPHRSHPVVLKLGWKIYAKAMKWDRTLLVDRGLFPSDYGERRR